MVLIRVTIYQDDLGLYTPEAYEELRLQFSTGDFHVHKATVEVVNEPHPDSYVDLDLLLTQINGQV